MCSTTILASLYSSSRSKVIFWLLRDVRKIQYSYPEVAEHLPSSQTPSAFMNGGLEL